MTFLSRIIRIGDDNIGKKISSLQCEKLTSSQNERILELVRKTSEELDIARPTVYCSKLIKNNAYSESGWGRNVIIISENLLNNLSDSQLDLVIQHEIFHLKFENKKTYVLSELLSDAFSVLKKKNFDEMRNMISTIMPNESPQIMSGFHSYFTSERRTQKTKKSREQIQREKRADYEKDGFFDHFFRRAFFDRRFYDEYPPNWVDAIHSTDHRDDQLTYDTVVRTEFLDDLQMMCERNVEIVTTPHTRKMLELPKGEMSLHSMWDRIFKIHGVDEQSVDAVFEYIKEHKNNFNLTDCSKTLELSEFAILLFMFQLIMYRKIILKWRFPCKFDFDY